MQNEADNSREALVKIGKVGESLQNIGGKISGVGQSLLPVTAAIAGVGAAGASSFAEVDKTMQLANKTMGNTAEEAEAVNNAMKNAAANSVYGMDDASNAMLNFARAGLKSEAAISVLTPAMNLAAGEGGELDTVSAGLVATMNSFHASFYEAETYANTFAAACNNSALDINSLCDSMSVAGPIFSAAGYGLKDTAWAMGLIGDAGLEAEVSANSLKTGLARLATATSENAVGQQLSQLGFKMEGVADIEAKLGQAQDKLEEKTATLIAKQTKYNEVLEKYGENSSQALTAQAQLVKAENDFENAQAAVNALTQDGSGKLSEFGAILVDDKGEMKPFTEVVKTLQSAFSGFSEQKQLAAASTIFGKNQMAPWLALINTAPERLDELSASLDNSTGLTQEMADTMMNGFGGGIEKLKSSIDVLLYSIGESLAPILQKVIDFLQKLVDKFNALSPQTKETIVKIGLVVAAIAPLLIVIGKIISTVGTLMTVISKIPAIITKVKGGFTAVKVVLSSTTGTILGVVAIIGALVAAFVYFWNTNEDFRNFWIGLWEHIKITLYGFFNAFKTGWDSIISFFKNTWSNFQENFQIGMDAIKALWTNIWNAVSGFFTTIWTSIKNFLVNIWTSIYITVSSRIELVKNIIVTVWNAIYTTIKPLLEAFRYLFETIFEAVKILIGRAMDWISTKIQDIWNAIVAFITPILESIRDFFINIFDTVKNTVGDVMDSVSEKMHNIWNGIVEFITLVLEGIKNFFVNTWNEIKTNISEKMNTIKNVISTIWDTIKTNVSVRMNIIKNTVSNIWENVKSAVSEKVTSIKTTITDGFNNAVDFVKGLASDAWNWGSDIISGIVDGIKSKISDIANAVTDVANTIREYLHFSVPDKGPLTDFESWMPDFISGLVKGINKNKKYIENAVNGVAEAMKLTLNSNLAYSFDGISGMMINGGTSGTVNNYYQTDNSRTVNQTNNSPKSLSRLEIYRQTKNALGV
ncbi:MAG: phage tail tape measure protein [Ruminococcus sp.]|nr:phage tail tape measure protein [Ruminococcus sp.]